MKIKTAIIPAAGLGTRFLPVTKCIPKEMLPIVDMPCIHYIVKEAVDSGIENIILIVSKGKNSIIDYFDNPAFLKHQLEKSKRHKEIEELEKIEKMANFFYVRQDKPLGDGHAILCAKELVKDQDFAVLYGDDIFDSETPAIKQLIEKYEKHSSPIIGLQEIPHEETYKYGIMDANKSGDSYKITNMVEKPKIEDAPSNLAAIGKYIVSAELMKTLENTRKEENSELRLIDGMINYLQKGEIYGHIITGKRFDTGDKLGYLKACNYFAKKRGFDL